MEKLEDFLITDKEKSLLLLSKLLNPSTNIYIKELKRCFELDFIINSLEEITIKDIYDFIDKNNNELKENDKNLIRDTIIKYIEKNEDGITFKDIFNHVELQFTKYNISRDKLMTILKSLKQENYITYNNKNNKWSKNNIKD